MPFFCNVFPRPVLNGVLFFTLVLAHPGAPVPAVETDAKPERKMTRRQVDRLAERYISTVEDKNVEEWKALLAPLHAGASELNEDCFLEQAERIDSLSVEDVDGYNVHLSIRYASGDHGNGLLQLDPGGRIKYTPVCFKHPLYVIVENLDLLLRDQITIMGATTDPATRAKAVLTLRSMRVPLFDYDPYSPSIQQRRKSAQKIFKWLKEHGPEFDKNPPKCVLPAEEFQKLITRLQKQLR